MNEEDSDSDFGDWDRDNWRDSETTAEVKNAKSAVTAVRDALIFCIQRSDVFL